jgi:type II secretory pathway component PulF
VASLMHLLEPIMVVLLGGMVLTIVMSIFLPMIKIITTLNVSG